MENINKRIKYVYNYFSISQTEAAKELEKSLSTISGYFKTTYPSEYFIVYTLKKFKTLNARWLFTGEGDFLINQNQNPVNSEAERLLDQKQLIEEVMFLKQKIEELEKNQNKSS